MARQEWRKRYITADGKIVTVILRDGIVPEDALIHGAKAKAYAIRTNSVDTAKPIPKSVKDFLIKANVSI